MRISRKDRLGITVVGRVIPGFAMEPWDRAGAVRAAGPRPSGHGQVRGWQGPRGRGSTERHEGMESSRMQGLRFRQEFFCVSLTMQHFSTSNMHLCWMTFVPFAQGLKPVQKLRSRTESSSEQCPGVPDSHTRTATRGGAFTHTGN